MKQVSYLLILEELGTKSHFKEKLHVQNLLWPSQFWKDPDVRSPVTETEN